jgi:short-subunit dehydrogenase
MSVETEAVARAGHRAFREEKVVAIAGHRNLLLAQSVRLAPRSVVRRIAKWLNASSYADERSRT